MHRSAFTCARLFGALVAILLEPSLVLAAPPPAGEAGQDALAHPSGSSTLPSVDVHGTRPSYAPNAPLGVAGKMGLTLRQTPHAVSVITRQRIEDQGLTTAVDVMRWMPGITIYSTNDSEANTFYSRGYVLNNIMVDGVLLGGSFWQTPADLSMYESMELLRGPAGFFAGNGQNGSPGGALNMVRKRPVTTPRRDIQLGIGSWNYRRTTLDVGGALTDDGRLRSRAVVSYIDRDFHYDYAHRRNLTLYGALAYDLAEHSTLTLGLEFERRRSIPSSAGLPLRGDGSDPRWPRNKTTVLPWGRWHADTPAGFVELAQRFNDHWNLRVVYAQKQENLLWDWGYVSGTVDPIPGSNQRQTRMVGQSRDDDSKEHSVDVRVNGGFDLFGQSHQLAFGFDWMKRSRWALYPLRQGYGSWEADYPVLVDFENFDPSLYPRREAQIDPAYFSTYGPTLQRGIFLNLRMQITEPLVLTTGARLSRYGYGGYTRQAEGTYRSGAYERSNVLTPYAALSYDFNAHHSVFFSYADIFRVQNAYTRELKMVDPQLGKNLELGWKSEYYEGQLNTSVSVYQLDRVNATRTDPHPDARTICRGFPNENSVCQIADNDRRVRGLDMEISGRLTENWDISAGANWLTKKYTRWHDSRGGTHANQGQTWDRDQPSRMFKLWSAWRLPGAASQWRIGGGMLAQSRIFSSRSASGLVPAATTVQGGYATYSAMVRWEINPFWSAQLNLNNVLDKWYYTSVGTSTVVYGEPRNFMLNVNARF